jgi:3-hydroxyisobutyrate dehydrogenase-like beta-hydroxyacid dehydrogenase
MGGAMAVRLLESGVSLIVCDRNPEVVAPLRERGALVADSPRAVADTAEIVFASLPSAAASMEVALGAEGAAKGKAVKIYAETSTIGSAAIQAIDHGFRSCGAGFLDAPVSGGPTGARAGTLAMLVSGAEAAFERARPAMAFIASSLFYLGDTPGISQIAKLINNHVSAAGRVAVFEGLAMGMKAGLDPKIMNDVLNASSRRNYTTTHKVPAAILTGSYKFNGPLTIGLKDEALLLDEAKRLGVPLWIAPRILDLYEEAAERGYRHQDGMRLFQYIQEQACAEGGASDSNDEVKG